MEGRGFVARVRYVVRCLLIAVVFGMAFLFTVRPGEATELGLAERRGLKAYQEKIWPDQLAAIQAAAGTPIEVEVHWEKLASRGYGQYFLEPEWFTNVYFVPLSKALAEVGRDDIGREAIKAKLKRVVVTFDDATAPVSTYENGLRFEDGTLTVNFRPGENASDVDWRVQAIVALLEKNL